MSMTGPYEAAIVADSVGPNGIRLTTLEVTIPRIVLAEFNTHRVFSRNSASSRAIPVHKRIAAVESVPYIPDAFGGNVRGMQPGEAIVEQDEARRIWLSAMRSAVLHAKALAELGVHKQWANRLVEPFAWQTILVTSTEWDNFQALRCNPEAQAEIRKGAESMMVAMENSTPDVLPAGGWHLPLVDERDQFLPIEDQIKLSVARCARVSYLTHDGKRDPDKDLQLHDRLRTSGHMSPFEHPAQARPEGDLDWSGNFRGWCQYRKTIPGEDVFGSVAR